MILHYDEENLAHMRLDNYLMASEDEGGRFGYPGMKERLYQLGTSPPKEQHLAHKVEGLIDLMGLQEGLTNSIQYTLL